MRAVGVRGYGGAEVLEVVDLPDPLPGPGEVRVRARAAGVAPVDVMLRTGKLAALYDAHPLPYVPGMEVAGTVDVVGEGVDVAVGSSVIGFVDGVGSRGAYSEYVVLPADAVAPAPDGIALEAAASFLASALTADAVVSTLALEPGMRLVVTGAGGGVGGYVTRLASRAGVHVIGVAGAVDEGLVRALGAAEFVARDAPVPTGADAVADAALIGAPMFDAIRDGGQYATFRAWTGDEPPRGIVLHRVSVRTRARDRAGIVRMSELASSGILPTRVRAVFPAAEAAAAHRLLETGGGSAGRIVLRFPVEA
jgi:NADPH:quinone reductase